MHAQFMTGMQREARNAWEKEHRQVRKRLRRGVTVLRELAETVLALRPSPEAPLSTLLAHIDPHRIDGAVADCVKFERLERYGLLDKLHGKYANFRRYFRAPSSTSPLPPSPAVKTSWPIWPSCVSSTAG